MTGKPLWVHILTGIGIVILLVVVFLQSLHLITRHDKTLTIPAVTGKSFAEARQILESKGFEVELQDSIYNDTAKPLSVLRQFPDAEALVKVNRTVYLTINKAIPPLIEMPNLEGLSFRSAEISMNQYGLKLEDTLYRTDFAKNSVLEQQYNGERIKAGTKVPQGSPIVLILGSGLGHEDFSVPDLVGLNYNDAKVLLESNGLNVGSVIPGIDPNAFVGRQSPEHMSPDGRVNRIRQGQSVDLWLQADKPVRLPAGEVPEPVEQ
ncbi:PASTA domain-containing protein [Niastella caeni]|uniref:PASTA domain-containing protein n=1 Tax=Niastella caeni TaxID=2569763 RepID=A0A4S8HYI3_9BACT|nr:PASTA domain-containing protein [Niastella caeni]THU40730.1 PASTA domain-containing protein [Niastella caeni]